jgi:hypothetical protein
MPEGLNPIESGKKLYEHGEAPDRPAESGDGHGGSGDRHRIIQICEAVLLAVVTVTAAWGGLLGGEGGAPRRASRSLSLPRCATSLPGQS